MIVFPMAGLSSRFYKEGYTKPKFELSLGGVTVFERSVLSFSKYFKTDNFLFICRKELLAKKFIEDSLIRLGVDSFKILELESETLGQADTVYQGVRDIDEEIYIFNIDTFLLDFNKPTWIDSCDGYLEVFETTGENWSFVESGENNTVIRTTEKDRISNLCSNGLYYFRSSKIFCSIVESCILNKDFNKREIYIAPLYNQLIKSAKKIKYQVVVKEVVEVCGTPDEYLLLQEKYRNL
jgi:NDP-sugar pyrophosphorylase family protein